MLKYPKIFKFKNLCKKLRREKLLTPHRILLYCTNTDQFKNELNKITKRTIKKISNFTKNQANSEDWFYFRKNIITGTLTKRICTAIKKGENNLGINKAITKKYCTKLYYPAVLYGEKYIPLGIRCSSCDSCCCVFSSWRSWLTWSYWKFHAIKVFTGNNIHHAADRIRAVNCWRTVS